MSDDAEPVIEIEADDAPDRYRYYNGLPVPEAAYQSLFEEFADWNELQRWPEEQAQNRLKVYGDLVETLCRVLAHETGAENGLESDTDAAVNKTICVVLSDLCRMVKSRKGD